MRKVIVFFLIVFLGAGSQLQAAKPIPSYKDPVSRVANYTEKKHKNDSKSDPKGKRYMIIVASVAGPVQKTPVSIWVYSLDKRDILGPYVIINDGEISVPIDNRLWGVLVECDGKAIVSVWTE